MGVLGPTQYLGAESFSDHNTIARARSIEPLKWGLRMPSINRSPLEPRTLFVVLLNKTQGRIMGPSLRRRRPRAQPCCRCHHQAPSAQQHPSGSNQCSRNAPICNMETRETSHLPAADSQRGPAHGSALAVNRSVVRCKVLRSTYIVCVCDGSKS